MGILQFGFIGQGPSAVAMGVSGMWREGAVWMFVVFFRPAYLLFPTPPFREAPSG